MKQMIIKKKIVYEGTSANYNFARIYSSRVMQQCHQPRHGMGSKRRDIIKCITVITV